MTLAAPTTAEARVTGCRLRQLVRRDCNHRFARWLNETFRRARRTKLGPLMEGCAPTVAHAFPMDPLRRDGRHLEKDSHQKATLAKWHIGIVLSRTAVHSAVDFRWSDTQRQCALGRITFEESRSYQQSRFYKPGFAP